MNAGIVLNTRQARIGVVDSSCGLDPGPENKFLKDKEGWKNYFLETERVIAYLKYQEIFDAQTNISSSSEVLCRYVPTNT